MKKGLALLLAASMSLSAFSTAFAADLTAEEKFKELVEKKIFQGFEDGSSRLDENMTRAQFATVIANLLGLEEVKPATPTFKDVKADHWVYGDLEAAVKAGLINGMGDGTFAPSANVTVEQMAKLLVEALDLEVDANATVEGTVSPSMAGYVAAAIKAGFIEASSNYKTPAKRELLVNATYVAEDEINSDVSATAVVNKDNTVTISGEAAEATEVTVKVGTAFEQKVAVTEGKYTVTTPVLASGKHTAVVSAGDESASAEFEIAAAQYAVKPIGVKKVEVKFGTAVDTAKAAFTVKKGNVPVNIAKVTFSDDKTTAIIELSTKFTKGEYTVAAANVAATELSAKFTAEDERVTKIELNNDTAAAKFSDHDSNTATPDIITGATLTYKVFNQYDENITDGTTVNWNSTLGTVSSDNKGKLTFTFNYTKGQTLFVTGYVGTTTVSKQITIGDRAYVNSVTVKELYHKDGKELNTKSTFADYSLILEAKDQYGNAVDATAFNNDVYFYSSNPTVSEIVAAVDANNGKDGNALGLDLKLPTGQNFEGEAVINFVPKFGGQTASFTVKVVKAAEVTSFTMTTPNTVIGANETVTVPFTAADQFGKEVTKYSELVSAINLTPNGGASGNLRFEEDVVSGKAILKYTAPATKGTYVLYGIPKVVSPTPSQLIVEVKDTKAAKVVTNYKGSKTVLAQGSNVSLKASDLVIVDQYGLEMDLATVFTNNDVLVTVGDNNEFTVGSDNRLVNKDDAVTLTAHASNTGYQNVKFVLVNKSGTTEVTDSALEKSFRVVGKSDISAYEVADIPTIYGGAGHVAEHNVALDIYGKLSDGSKVVLNSSSVSVTASVYGTIYSGGKLDASAVTFSDANQDKKGLAVVLIDGADGSVQLTKEITVTNKAPVVTTIAVEEAGGITLKDGVAVANVSEVTIANLVALFTAKDQYGAPIAINNPMVSFTGVTKATGSTFATQNGFVTGGTQAAITGAPIAGDTFTVNIITGNGTINSVKVKVIAD